MQDVFYAEFRHDDKILAQFTVPILPAKGDAIHFKGNEYRVLSFCWYLREIQGAHSKKTVLSVGIKLKLVAPKEPVDVLDLVH